MNLVNWVNWCATGSGGGNVTGRVDIDFSPAMKHFYVRPYVAIFFFFFFFLKHPPDTLFAPSPAVFCPTRGGSFFLKKIEFILREDLSK